MENIKFEKDFKGRAITVTTTYAAQRETVWEAYTDPAILEKWWAPRPWKAVSVKMDFRNGGRWLYYMASPEGQKSWSLAEFGEIVPGKSYEALDAFCDKNGKVDISLPRLHWMVTFAEEGGKTTVTARITANEEEALRRIIEMGFEEGYKMGITQLHDLLKP